MLGAIAGDIIGFPFEYVHKKDYDFELISNNSIFTDDTVITLAVAQWLTESDNLSSDELVWYMQSHRRQHPSDYKGQILKLALLRQSKAK